MNNITIDLYKVLSIAFQGNLDTIEKQNTVRRVNALSTELTSLLFLAKEMEVFSSFKTFEKLAHLTVSIAKQSRTWVRKMHNISNNKSQHG